LSTHLQSRSIFGSVPLAAIFAVVLIGHAVSPVTTSTDSAWTFHVAASVLRQGNFDLDEYRPVMNLALDYRLRQIRGHVYYYYPVATPLFVAPAVWMINVLYPMTHTVDFYTYLEQHAPDDRTARLERLLASGVVAAAACLMYLIARRSLGQWGAMGIAGIFAFGTSMWSTASRALWQHGPSVLFLTAALLLLLIAKDRKWIIFLVGALLGYGYWIRPTNSLSVVFIGAYFLVAKRRLLLAYVGGVMAIILPFLVLNWTTYGNIFPPYSYQLFERFGTPREITQGLVGTLISPNRGLFVFTPLFLFSLYGAYLAVRGGARLHSIEPFLAAIVFSHWLVTSLFEDWGGAWSIGPRYFVDIIPYLVYFLIPVFQAPAFSRTGLRTVFIGCLAVSFLIQLHCSVSPYPFMWNGKPQALVDAPQRKWDWGDLQFLRGLCPGDALEGRAPACWFRDEV
jgi:hypothetical protein